MVKETTEIKEEKEKTKEKQESLISTEKSEKKKSKKNTIVGIIVAIVIIIAIVVIALLVFNKHPVTKQDVYNITYLIEFNGSSLNESSIAVASDFGSAIGIKKNIDTEVKSMKPGEEKTIFLEAKDAFGEYDESKLYTYNRTEKIERVKEINRITKISLSLFKQTFDEEPIVNKTYSLSGVEWNYTVISIENDQVKLRIDVEKNKELSAGYFTSKIINVTDTKITLELQGKDEIIPSENGNIEVKFTSDYVYMTLTPVVGDVITLGNLPKARVIKYDDKLIYLDANNELAGKAITLKIKLNNISTISSRTSNTTMQVFIMSHCPYGTQIVKGMLPVWRAFKGNYMELRFVSYTMHGDQEALDNNRIICIREEQSNKLLDYLDCFVHGDGTESGSQKCIAQVKIDKTKLDSCVASRALSYMAVDKELNTRYNVQGSPTVIINGKKVDVYPRDATTIAKALCATFTSKPSQCSQPFSTTNPAPGFGPDDSGSSSTGGSCS